MRSHDTVTIQQFHSRLCVSSNRFVTRRDQTQRLSYAVSRFRHRCNSPARLFFHQKLQPRLWYVNCLISAPGRAHCFLTLCSLIFGLMKAKNSEIYLLDEVEDAPVSNYERYLLGGGFVKMPEPTTPRAKLATVDPAKSIARALLPPKTSSHAYRPRMQAVTQKLRSAVQKLTIVTTHRARVRSGVKLPKAIESPESAKKAVKHICSPCVATSPQPHSHPRLPSSGSVYAVIIRADGKPNNVYCDPLQLV